MKDEQERLLALRQYVRLTDMEGQGMAEVVRAKATCSVCGQPISRNNLVGVCLKTAECRREKRRLWRIGHPDQAAAANRRWHAKHKEEIHKKQRAAWAKKRDMRKATTRDVLAS